MTNLHRLLENVPTVKNQVLCVLGAVAVGIVLIYGGHVLEEGPRSLASIPGGSRLAGDLMYGHDAANPSVTFQQENGVHYVARCGVGRHGVDLDTQACVAVTLQAAVTAQEGVNEVPGIQMAVVDAANGARVYLMLRKNESSPFLVLAIQKEGPSAAKIINKER
jgi:hypothetical protein